jgi:hypothetical protein
VQDTPKPGHGLGFEEFLIGRRRQRLLFCRMQTPVRKELDTWRVSYWNSTRSESMADIHRQMLRRWREF